jgi:hypothetical protein
MAHGERMSGASGWQPIETAPRDGTQIIGYDPEWHAEHRMEWDGEWDSWAFHEEILNDISYLDDCPPTWWRPAPDLPKARPHQSAADAPPYDGGPETDDFGSA